MPRTGRTARFPARRRRSWPCWARSWCCVIGLALLGVLVAGIADGVPSAGVRLLGALCLGVFALAGRWATSR